MSHNGKDVTALVLTGGGARGAYQVGALRAIADLVGERSPFDLVAGVSAGALNGAAVATSVDDFAAGVARLEATWRALTPEQVYRTDLASLGEIAVGWLRRLGGGGFLGADHVNALLDTSPLRALLRRTLAMAHVRDHVASGRLRGLAVTATSYQSGQAISFFDGHPAIEPWTRAGRVGQRARLSVEHVLASAAIPVLFPPVTVGGAALGDGCIRLTAPLSPAIHLGAERIVAIGIQAAGEPPAHDRAARPTPAEIGGVLLNAVFLDSLEADAERHLRINSTLAAMAPAQRAAQALREIPLLVLRPSVDLGQLAVEQYRELPVALRYLLRGIGADGQRGWDLVSYLAFEPVYVQRLVELGYRDTCARRDELMAFLAPPR
ncbi:MAG: patatin-like phospholipase family protein [Kofleriaceae bacterium]|nr:patatin-like phospholipase family protein [Kofleriaceae bacterium]MCL4227560.1 patatin-like phospholipase family protein [Myxococcales bacterium]